MVQGFQYFFYSGKILHSYFSNQLSKSSLQALLKKGKIDILKHHISTIYHELQN